MAAKTGSDRFLETSNPTGITGYEQNNLDHVFTTNLVKSQNNYSSKASPNLSNNLPTKVSHYSNQWQQYYIES
jgi:hypothetical protein